MQRGLPADEADDLAGELADHLEDLVLELRSNGFPPKPAERQAYARLGSMRALETSILRSFQRRSLVGRLPLLFAFLLPAAFLAGLVWTNIQLARTGYTLLLLIGFASGVVDRLVEIWNGLVPYLYSIPGSILLCAAFSRSLVSPWWTLLSCLLFSLLNTTLRISVVSPVAGSTVRRFLTAGFSFHPHPFRPSPVEIAGLLAPLVVGITFLGLIRLRRSEAGHSR